jgi:hypothetical protein
MPAPILVPIAVAIARAIAAQAAKQGVKKLAQSEARIIARKVIAQKGGPKALSGKSLDRAINIANQSGRSSKPVRNTGGGLRTTYSGPPKGKISKVAATRAAEKAAGPRARREGGNSALRSVLPKPNARITRTTSRGTTVSQPVKRTTNKSGSAITVRKTEPRKAAEVRAERAKAKRDKLRDALTPRVNPARPKPTPKRGSTGKTDNNAREKEIIDRYYRIRFRDKDAPTARSTGDIKKSIDSRIAAGYEKPTRGSTPSKYDTEAGARIDEAVKASTRVKATVKPGKPTKATVALRTVGGSKKTKAARNAELKGIIRNQRKVLKQREIKEAGEKIRKAEEAAKIREAAAKRSGKSLLKGRVIKNTGAQ